MLKESDDIWHNYSYINWLTLISVYEIIWICIINKYEATLAISCPPVKNQDPKGIQLPCPALIAGNGLAAPQSCSNNPPEYWQSRGYTCLTIDQAAGIEISQIYGQNLCLFLAMKLNNSHLFGGLLPRVSWPISQLYHSNMFFFPSQRFTKKEKQHHKVVPHYISWL